MFDCVTPKNIWILFLWVQNFWRMLITFSHWWRLQHEEVSSMFLAEVGISHLFFYSFLHIREKRKEREKNETDLFHQTNIKKTQVYYHQQSRRWLWETPKWFTGMGFYSLGTYIAQKLEKVFVLFFSSQPSNFTTNKQTNKQTNRFFGWDTVSFIGLIHAETNFLDVDNEVQHFHPILFHRATVKLFYPKHIFWVFGFQQLLENEGVSLETLAG